MNALPAALAARDRLIPTGAPIWVAFSGGPDSSALLHAAVRHYGPGRVTATHVDHGLQPESGAWAAHCRQVCAVLGVRLAATRLRPPARGASEAWARTERYRFWQARLPEGAVLLLAHHADDQQETVALRLLQGRLPLPIPERRVLGAGTLLRPLLELPRAVLREAVDRLGRSLDDPSNRNPALLRSRVRQQVLPRLQPRHAWDDALLRLGALTARLDAALLMHRVPLAAGWGLCGRLEARTWLVAAPSVWQWLFRALHLPAPSAARVRDALGTLRRGTPARFGPDSRLEVWPDGAALVLWRAPPLAPSYPVSGPGEIWLPHGTLVLAAGVQRVRCWRPGDRDARGVSLRERLRAAGVPRWRRASLPLVEAADGFPVLPRIERPGALPVDADAMARWLPADALLD